MLKNFKILCRKMNIVLNNFKISYSLFRIMLCFFITLHLHQFIERVCFDAITEDKRAL